jgi:hypothetical protein
MYIPNVLENLQYKHKKVILLKYWITDELYHLYMKSPIKNQIYYANISVSVWHQYVLIVINCFFDSFKNVVNFNKKNYIEYQKKFSYLLNYTSKQEICLNQPTIMNWVVSVKIDNLVAWFLTKNMGDLRKL